MCGHTGSEKVPTILPSRAVQGPRVMAQRTWDNVMEMEEEEGEGGRVGGYQEVVQAGVMMEIHHGGQIQQKVIPRMNPKKKRRRKKKILPRMS